MAAGRIYAVQGVLVLLVTLAVTKEVPCDTDPGIFLEETVRIGNNFLKFGYKKPLCVEGSQVALIGAFEDSSWNRADTNEASLLGGAEILSSFVGDGEAKECIATSLAPGSDPHVCETGDLTRPNRFSAAPLKKVVMYPEPKCTESTSREDTYDMYKDIVSKALDKAYGVYPESEHKIISLVVPGMDQRCGCPHCRYLPFTIGLVREFLSLEKVKGTTVVIVVTGAGITEETLQNLFNASKELDLNDIRKETLDCGPFNGLFKVEEKVAVKGCSKFFEVLKKSASALTNIPEYPYLVPASEWGYLNIHDMLAEYREVAGVAGGDPMACIPYEKLRASEKVSELHNTNVKKQMDINSDYTSVHDCVISGDIPLKSFPVDKYVNATQGYRDSVRGMLNAWREEQGDNLEDEEDMKLSEKTITEFLDKFFRDTLEGPKSHVRRQLHEWFRHVAMVAHEHPGVLRAFRKTLSGMLRLIQAWQLRWESNDYEKILTPKEVDYILNEKAPRMFGQDKCSNHLGGNVGNSTSAILQVVRNGNLREMAQLVVAGLDCETPKGAEKVDFCFKEIMFDIAETLYGKAKRGKSTDQYVKISDEAVKSYNAKAQPKDLDKESRDKLDIDATTRQKMIQFIKENGIQINMHLLWQQYRRIVFGDKLFLANPKYDLAKCTKYESDGEADVCKEKQGYHILGIADLDPKVKSAIYKKMIWAPRPGWVMASRLPGEFSIREKPNKDIIDFRMNPLAARGSGVIDNMHPAIWTWKDIFDYGGVAFVSRRERDEMLQCKLKQPKEGGPDSKMAEWISTHTRLKAKVEGDSRWSQYDDNINDGDRCPWNSGATYNVMKNVHFPAFSPEQVLSYSEVSERDLGGVDAGPSGTTDEVLLSVTLMNGNTNDLFAARLGMIGYLVPYHHHTWLEVLQGASGYGLYYRKESPSNDLLPVMSKDMTSKKCEDLAPQNAQMINPYDIGMGSVGHDFDRLVAMWVAKTQVRKAAFTDMDLDIKDISKIWFDQRIGLSVQLHDPAYTLSPEGAMFHLCHLARNNKINYVLPARIIRESRECAYLEKLGKNLAEGGKGLPEAACALQKTLRDDDGEPLAEDSPIDDHQSYLDSRAYVCYLAHQMYHTRTQMYHTRTPRYNKEAIDSPLINTPRSTSYVSEMPEDHAFGELLSLCNGIRKGENKEDVWPMSVNTVFMRDLNALLAKIFPTRTNSVNGLECKGSAHRVFMDDSKYDELRMWQTGQKKEVGDVAQSKSKLPEPADGSIVTTETGRADGPIATSESESKDGAAQIEKHIEDGGDGVGFADENLKAATAKPVVDEPAATAKPVVDEPKQTNAEEKAEEDLVKP